MAAAAGGAAANSGLVAAKRAKQDEFYTQYVDVQQEVEAYLEFDPDTFRGKVVYCNCDDPFESNFFKYFATNFNKLRLKRLITTSYDGSPIAGQGTLFPEYERSGGRQQRPKATAVVIDHVRDEDGDGAANLDDVKLFLTRNEAARVALDADDEYPGGDFRSACCVKFLEQADIVVTNPPFSLFRQYVAQLVQYGLRFLIIGNTNAITYRDIFPLIKQNELWLGCTNFNVGMFFEVPDDWERFHHIDGETGKKIARVSTACWYTNLDHGRRHLPLQLMTVEENTKFSRRLREKKGYDHYDNYDAIEVSTYKEIPSDYEGVMGVPITFLDKYNPEQFEIVGTTESNDPNNACRTRVYSPQECRDAYEARFGEPGVYDLNASGVVDGVKVFKRVLIRHRRKLARKKKK